MNDVEPNPFLDMKTVILELLNLFLYSPQKFSPI